MNKYRLYLILFLLIIIGCETPEEQEKEAPLKIVYNVWYDRENDDYEVFSMNLDGSDVKNISNSSGVDWVYYAYDDKVYFISDRDTTHRMYFLYEMDSEGNNIRKITDFNLNDSWLGSRKNGQELVVRPHRNVDSVFYIIDLEGNVLSKVNTGLAYFNDPFFSPDGSKIVFRGSEKKFKKDNDYIDELYVINEDGSGLMQLTHYPKSDTTSNWWNYHAGPPFWLDKQNIITYNSVQNGKSRIFSITPDGKKNLNLLPDSANGTWHAWSIDGKYLVFDSKIEQDDTTNYDILLLDTEVKSISHVTKGGFYEQAPVFVKSSQ